MMNVRGNTALYRRRRVVMQNNALLSFGGNRISYYHNNHNNRTVSLFHGLASATTNSCTCSNRNNNNLFFFDNNNSYRWSPNENYNNNSQRRTFRSSTYTATATQQDDIDRNSTIVSSRNLVSNSIESDSINIDNNNNVHSAENNNDQNVIRIKMHVQPSEPLYLKQIDSILTKIPIGSMDRYAIMFAHRAIQKLSSDSPPGNDTYGKKKRKSNVSLRNAETCERLVERLVAEEEYYYNQYFNNTATTKYEPKARITTKMYNHCLLAWARCETKRLHEIERLRRGNQQQRRGRQQVDSDEKDSTSNSLYQAKNLLERMIQRNKTNPLIHPPLDDYSYCVMLLVCANHYYDPDASTIATNLIKQLEQNLLLATNQNDDSTAADSAENSNPSSSSVLVLPDTNMYNNMMLLYARRSDTQYGAASAAEDLLMHMTELTTTITSSTTSNNTVFNILPDTRTFNRALQAWSVAPESNGADRALEILNLMFTLSKVNASVRPDFYSFGTVINAFGRRSRPLECDAVFNKAIEYYLSFNNNSNRIVNTGNEQSEMQEMIHYIESKDDSVDDDVIDNDDKLVELGDDIGTMNRGNTVVDLTYCLNGAIRAWSESGLEESPERIEVLIRDAYTLSNPSNLPGHIIVRPDHISHQYCIESYMNGTSKQRHNSVELADQHLQRLIDRGLQQLNDPSRGVDTLSQACFIRVVRGYHERCLKYHSSRKRGHDQQQQEPQGRQQHNDDPVVSPEAWANRCYELLKHMIHFSEHPAHSSKNNYCIPNDMVFQLCIDSYWMIRTCTTSYPHRVLEILNMAEERQLSNDSSYQVAINYLCLSSDNHMKELRRARDQRGWDVPDGTNRKEKTNLYPNEETAFDAVATLIRYENEVDRRGLGWNDCETTRLYTSVISSLSKLKTPKAADAALSLLNRMQMDIESAQRTKLQPTQKTYTAAILAIRNGRQKEMVGMVYDLFEKMKLEDADPTCKFFFDQFLLSMILTSVGYASEDRYRADRACSVLLYMLHLHCDQSRLKKHTLQPDTRDYDICLEAMMETRDPAQISRAVQILKVIGTKYEEKSILYLPTLKAVLSLSRACMVCGTTETMKHAKAVDQLARKLFSDGDSLTQ